MNTEKIEWHDVQGLLLSGYPQLPYSAYVAWHFLPGQRDAAKRWLRDLAERLMRADRIEGEDDGATDLQLPPTNIRALKAMRVGDRTAINLAITASGLQELDLDEHQLSDFSVEFLEGMAPKPTSGRRMPRRSGLLGDAGESSPCRWEWGGWGPSAEVHGMLLLYASEEHVLQALVQAELHAMNGVADVVVTGDQGNGRPVIVHGRLYDDAKEHFGFVDGISQPIIEGSPLAIRSEENAKNEKKAKSCHTPADSGERDRVLSAKDRRISLVKPGEFVLGYRNERRERISSQSVKPGSNLRDLLRNGTYLVFRQLEQDVDAFEKFVASLATRMHGKADVEATEEVAARLIGRYRNGAPLVRAGADSPSAPERNDFLYAYEDESGMACPIGAHIRRANPRDAIGSDPDVALKLSKMHRIIRRGRPYGARRGEQDETTGKGSRRGTAFIALNADIAGQFEMIQHSWLNNPQFGGLPVGTDPISHVAHDGDELVIQQRPFNLHIEKPRPFVTVRGGAYFFLPGINAIRALAD
jgi:Dyp-type peroxidase family